MGIAEVARTRLAPSDSRSSLSCAAVVRWWWGLRGDGEVAVEGFGAGEFVGDGVDDAPEHGLYAGSLVGGQPRRATKRFCGEGVEDVVVSVEVPGDLPAVARSRPRRWRSCGGSRGLVRGGWRGSMGGALIEAGLALVEGATAALRGGRDEFADGVGVVEGRLAMARDGEGARGLGGGFGGALAGEDLVEDDPEGEDVGGLRGAMAAE